MNYLIFVTILLTAVASNLAIMRVGRDNALTVSLHVAKTRFTINMFRILFGSATICFALWAYYFLYQNVTLGLVGIIAFIGITICFGGAALIPHILGTRGGDLHNVLAWGLVYLFPVAVAAIIVANPDPIIRLSGAVALFLLLTLLGGYSTVRSQRNYFLYYQISYVVIFFAYMSMLSLYV